MTYKEKFKVWLVQKVGPTAFAPAIKHLAESGSDGFAYVNKAHYFICKDHFLFRIYEYEKPYIWTGYLLKEMPVIDTEDEEIYDKYITKENALSVLDGLGYFETNSETINKTLSTILINAYLSKNKHKAEKERLKPFEDVLKKCS